MKAGNYLLIGETHCYTRPERMLGPLINEKVAAAAVRRIAALLGGEEKRAVKVFCGRATRRAFDQIESSLPITAEELMTLGAISETNITGAGCSPS